MVTFFSNSLLEINTSSILLIFLIEKELLVYLIYCIRLKKVSSFTLKAITSSINVFLLCKISNNFVHIHAILILMKTEHASGIWTTITCYTYVQWTLHYQFSKLIDMAYLTYLHIQLIFIGFRFFSFPWFIRRGFLMDNLHFWLIQILFPSSCWHLSNLVFFEWHWLSISKSISLFRFLDWF